MDEENTEQTGSIIPTPNESFFLGWKKDVDDGLHNAGKSLERVDKIVLAVVTILVATVVTLLVMVAGLILDSQHFNSAVYKEYSQKTASVETTQKTNEVLLKQIQELLAQGTQDREIIKGLLKK